jgi:hypothetical protein
MGYPLTYAVEVAWRKGIVVVAADFSSRGDPARGVDLVAPGKSIVGLRNPGSNVDLEHP